MSKNSLEEMYAHYNRQPRSQQPSSFHHNQQNTESQFSAADIERLENLKRYNLSQIKNLFPPGKPPGTNRSRSSILEDDTQSIQSDADSRLSSNRGSQAHFAQPNSYQSFSNSKYFTPSLGPILSRNPIEDEPSLKRTGLMSFKGSPREANSNSTLRTLSKTVGVDKYPQETYFEHNDFDVYMEAMSKRISEADIKSKFSELKHSANLLKLIAEAGPDDDIDQIFSKHMTPDLANVLDSSKPLYKMVAEAGVDHSALRNLREEQQVLASGRHSVQDSSRGGTQRGDVNSMVLGSAKRKILVDSQNKLSDRPESFEAFLMDQGIGAPVYSNAGGKSQTKESKQQQYEGYGGGMQQQDNNNSFSFIKQMDENVSMVHSQGGAGGLSADLHMFLMQNLREIMEVKDILRDGIAYGIMESRENLKESREEKKDDGPSVMFTQNNGEESQLEQKLHEGQMDRLVNKVQALNEKLKKYEHESSESKRMTQAMKKCLRIGKVKLSELIQGEVDIAGLTLDYLAKDYPLQARYLYVYTTHLAFCNDAGIMSEQEQRFHLSEIEQIYYLEKPGSTFFMMKMLEKDSEKGEKNSNNWTQESLKLSSQVKTKTIESLSHFYFIEIEEQAEMAAWELAFFVANFKIIAGNLSFSINKCDFLQVVRSFVQKYLASTGETSRSLVDLALKPQIQVNGSIPQLSRMTSTNSEQAGTGSEKLGIIDIWNRKKIGNMTNSNSLQLPAFVKKRSDDSEKIEVKEESVSAGNVPKKIVYQKQKSLPTRGISADDDLSSVEEGDSVGEGNLENSPDVREEKNRSNFIKTLSKGSTLELDDEVFSKNLAILLDGVVLSKYGKWGKSHDRHVKLSNDLMSIQWMHPLKGSKRRSGIEVNGIYSVLSGKKSMYFAKKKMLPPELELCFSIVAKSRSLHLQAPNLQTRDYFVEALEYIIKDKNKLKKVAEQADIKMRK